MLRSTRLSGETAGLLTDHYELTMLASALEDGTAERECCFEVFCRSLRGGRRYGVVAGTGRVLEAVSRFRFSDSDLEFLERTHVVGPRVLAYLADFAFRGDIDGYLEGELFFPFSPVLTVTGTFGEAVLLETLVLSILNHDSAVATAASRMVSAAAGRPIIEMGTRRTHEAAAVAAARAAYLAGFASTSNLEAGLTYGIPTRGTVAHAFVMLHAREQDAFAAQVAALGPRTTLLVDTYDTAEGVRAAVAAAGPELGAIRIDSGDLASEARRARSLLDSLGASSAQIVATSDLDEYSIAALADAPVDAYGVGTAVVTGSGVPAIGFVYKLVEVDGRPVAKQSAGKVSSGGRKTAWRRHAADGHATAEVVLVGLRSTPEPHGRPLQVSLVRGGQAASALPSLDECRQRAAEARSALPAEALDLTAGTPAIPTVRVGTIPLEETGP